MNQRIENKAMLFGVPIDNLTLEETVDRVESMIQEGGTHQHVVVNVDKIVKLQRDPELRSAVLSCDLINADGQPIVWASKLLQHPLKERVTGVDLFDSLVARCADKGYRPYLLGARQEIVEKVVEVLKQRHPDLKIAGYRNGYWQSAEEAEVVQGIKRTQPHMLFVAMGSPKKEVFLNKWKSELQTPFVMGVGGTFDVVDRIGKTRAAVDAKMWLGMVFPIDPRTAKDVAAVLGRRYGLFRLGIAGMAGTTAVIAIDRRFPLAFSPRFTRIARQTDGEPWHKIFITICV